MAAIYRYTCQITIQDHSFECDCPFFAFNFCVNNFLRVRVLVLLLPSRLWHQKVDVLWRLVEMAWMDLWNQRMALEMTPHRYVIVNVFMLSSPITSTSTWILELLFFMNEYSCQGDMAMIWFAMDFQCWQFIGWRKCSSVNYFPHWAGQASMSEMNWSRCHFHWSWFCSNCVLIIWMFLTIQ